MSFFCRIFVSEINEIMNYKIYQLDIRDNNVLNTHRLFASWDEITGSAGFDIRYYKKTYEGEVPAGDTSDILESLFRRFNIHRPDDFRGHSLSVSDVVELDGVMYYCDSTGWVDVRNGKQV